MAPLLTWMLVPASDNTTITKQNYILRQLHTQVHLDLFTTCAKQMLKISPNIVPNRHTFDLQYAKSYTMGLMCSQGVPKTHRYIDFCRHNGSQVTPQGSNSSPLAAKRHAKGFILMILGAQRVLPRPILTPKGHLLAFEVVSLGIQGQISSYFRFHVSVLVTFCCFVIAILGNDRLQTTLEHDMICQKCVSCSKKSTFRKHW